ncbi:hypothetical protein SLA2020_357930 [Shorea laevis]
MENGAFPPNSMLGTSPEAAMDMDFMDELLFEGCWLETSDGVNFMQPGPSISDTLNDPSLRLPSSGSRVGHVSISSHYQVNHEETDIKVLQLPSHPNNEKLSESQSQNQGAVGAATSSVQSRSSLVEGTELGSRWWIGPRAVPGHSSFVKDRLMQAIGYLKECTKDGDVLIQIWVPIKRGDKHVLTTEDQPYSLNTNCERLERYRNVSKNYNFPAEKDSKEAVGLPGRVYLGKLPEWTPDVRLFRSYEYPRINFAQQYDVRGSLGLPVFERGSGTCLGVVEIVTTTQKMNYRPELENVCKALEAVDLKSSENFSPLDVEVSNDLYQVALPEIAAVLRSVCKTHRLPLALTWAPCIRQGKGGCRHSDENYQHCVSTIDAACVVADAELLEFHEACSEHHLLRGEGIVGRAFTTHKQCFATNITAVSKTNYPLSHHARMFGLHAAVAIPLCSIYTRSVEFVLELFLPKDCYNNEQQKQMQNSLSGVMQQACRSLHVISDKELEEVILPVKEMVVNSDERPNVVGSQFRSSLLKESSLEESSIAHMREAQQKGKGISVSCKYQKEEQKREFKVTALWDNTQQESYIKQGISELRQVEQHSGTKSSVKGRGESSSGGSQTLQGRKSGEKRRTKREKAISLQVLQRYFAGSLKDAAKSIGVCPTTLKRICRQHGITRWPSRKIKKVGHSLRKLQLVIDSVQGAEGSIQIGSFYSTFPELSSPGISQNGPSSSLKMNDHPKLSVTQHKGTLFSQGTATLKSASSTCSRSSGSGTSCSTGARQHSTMMNALTNAEGLMAEDPGGVLKRAHGDLELHALKQDEPKPLARSQSGKTFGDQDGLQTPPPLPRSGSQQLQDGGAFKVKATFGEVKIRFSLRSNWSFRDLQHEIAKRFNIDDFSRISLKYLDDDHEWVLLTCDADLEECKDVYKPSQSHTIQISLRQAPHAGVGSSFGSSAPA